MSSDRFDFIVIEIPENIDKKTIRELRSAIKNIDIEDSITINRFLELDTQGVVEELLEEGDLFEIGEEGLKTKKAIHDFLNEAVSEVLAPRMYQENRVSTPLNAGDFSYMELNEKTYVISGQQASYYSSKLNRGYKYVLALSLSNLLAELLSN